MFKLVIVVLGILCLLNISAYTPTQRLCRRRRNQAPANHHKHDNAATASCLAVVWETDRFKYR